MISFPFSICSENPLMWRPSGVVLRSTHTENEALDPQPAVRLAC